jgi:phosphoribosylaminoimidazole-succinocarboxamide synthase
VKELSMFPLEVVVRNIATGSITRRLGVEKGREISPPIVEFYLKSDELHDPLLCEDHIRLLGLAESEEIKTLRNLALEINGLLSPHFEERGMTLVDIKFEFGKSGESILLADEISPEIMRIWDKETGRSLDKDVFRKDLGDLLEAYKEVARRLGVEGV